MGRAVRAIAEIVPMTTTQNDLERLRGLVAKWRGEIENRHNAEHPWDVCASCQQLNICADELDSALGVTEPEECKAQHGLYFCNLKNGHARGWHVALGLNEDALFCWPIEAAIPTEAGAGLREAQEWAMNQAIEGLAIMIDWAAKGDQPNEIALMMKRDACQNARQALAALRASPRSGEKEPPTYPPVNCGDGW